MSLKLKSIPPLLDLLPFRSDVTRRNFIGGEFLSGMGIHIWKQKYGSVKKYPLMNLDTIRNLLRMVYYSSFSIIQKDLDITLD